MTKIHERGRYSAALKEKVSPKTLQQIVSENSTSPELMHQWKKQAQ